VRAAAALLLVIASTGCVSYRSGLPLPDPADLRPGETTREEVYERFGIPDRICARGECVALTYEVGGGRGYAVGLVWRGTGFSANETRFARDSLVILLDPADRVSAARWTDGEGTSRLLGTE
jgi:hypothetical protein